MIRDNYQLGSEGEHNEGSEYEEQRTETMRMHHPSALSTSSTSISKNKSRDPSKGPVTGDSDLVQYPHPQIRSEWVTVRAKILSDLVEAIIGAYFIQGGLKAASAAIQALGSWPVANTDTMVAHVDEHVGAPWMLGASAPSPDLLSPAGRAFLRGDHETIVSIVESKVGYRFKDMAVLEEVLTHYSASHYTGFSDKPHNERLEFLGDAVLDLAVLTVLYECYPQASVGTLSGLKTASTGNKNLGIIGLKLNLQEVIIFASGSLSASFAELEERLRLHSCTYSRTFNTHTHTDTQKQTQTQTHTHTHQTPAAFSERTIGDFSLGPVEQSDGSSTETAIANCALTENASMSLPSESASASGSVKSPSPSPPHSISIPESILQAFDEDSDVSRALKVLGDTLEALIGAVYIDSGGDFAAVYRVVDHVGLISTADET
jgi:dsRNA-specific ribonuclease